MERITTKEVLKTIAVIGGVGGFVVASAVMPGLPMALSYAIRAWKHINRKDLGRIIKRLEKQEMISIKDKNGNTLIEITEKGRRRLLEYDFENITIKKKRLDGKWRLVIFDIPEEKRNIRDIFRRKLVQLDMVRLQDSVFASAYPCRSEVDFLCHFLEISNFVTIVKVDSIERGEKLIFQRSYTGYN